MNEWPFADSGDHVDGWDAPPPPMAELLDLLRGYLHLDDTGHVWFALATAVSSSLDSDPLWGMLVGASSGGKTETIRALDKVAGHVDELTSASLLSWHHGKKAHGGRSGCCWVGERGLLTVGDFSTVLAMSDRGARDQLFANLRRVYDGHLVRDVGNAPPPSRVVGAGHGAGRLHSSDRQLHCPRRPARTPLAVLPARRQADRRQARHQPQSPQRRGHRWRTGPRSATWWPASWPTPPSGRVTSL
jgi:hypothetical protein